MHQQTVRYTYRLRPGVQAERALTAEWHRCRWVWNEAVRQQATGRKPTFCKLSKLLTEARRCSEWLRVGSQMPQQQTLRDYAIALDRSYTVKGRQRPKLRKRKTSRAHLEYTARGFAIDDQARLRLRGGITMPVVWSRPLPAAPTSVRVYRDPLGHWYASFVVRRTLETAPAATGTIGIDWGVATTATTTDPRYDLPHLGHRKRCQAERAKAQRRMSRRQRGHGQPASKGYQRAARQKARIDRRAARQNQHDSRVWAQRVVRDHHLIAVEHFRPRFLAKTSMARKAADAAASAAKRALIEYGERAGRKVVLVPPAYTTMTCSSCFARNKQRLPLAERIFRCETCGHAAERDRNAARTILATAERFRAGADDIGRRVIPHEGMASMLSEPGISPLVAERR